MYLVLCVSQTDRQHPNHFRATLGRARGVTGRPPRLPEWELPSTVTAPHHPQSVSARPLPSLSVAMPGNPQSWVKPPSPFSNPGHIAQALSRNPSHAVRCHRKPLVPSPRALCFLTTLRFLSLPGSTAVNSSFKVLSGCCLALKIKIITVN